MIGQGEILTLSDNKVYSVVFSIMYEAKNYIYLVDQNDYNNSMICCYTDNSLEEVIDQELVTILLKKFNEK